MTLCLLLLFLRAAAQALNITIPEVMVVLAVVEVLLQFKAFMIIQAALLLQMEMMVAMVGMLTALLQVAVEEQVQLAKLHPL